jgi:hypothetical protein
MLTVKRLSLCVLFALTITSCVGMPPLPPPTPFRSILVLPEQGHTLYLPFAGNNTLGRGGALTYSYLNGCADAKMLGARWLHNWSESPPTCPGIARAALLWEQRVREGCPTLDGDILMTGNEPSWRDPPLLPETAAQITHWVATCFPDKPQISPAEINTDSFDGLPFMVAWRDSYRAQFGTEPPVAFVGMHCYASTGAICIARTKSVMDWARTWGKDVVLTEWGIVPRWAGITDAATNVAEAKKYLDWLDEQTNIAGEAFFAPHIYGTEVWSFGEPTSSLFVPGTDKLTAWGEWYTQNGLNRRTQ